VKFSVIIVSLNGQPRISMPLDAMRACEPAAHEVLLVDNGSTDGLSPYVKENYPEVELIRSPRNLGFAGGNNLGILNAGGDVVILLNDDTEPRVDWLGPLAAAFSANPKLGIAGCQLLYPGTAKVQHLGGIVHANGLTDHVGWGNAAHEGGAGLPPLIPADYVTGAAMAIRREVLAEVGLLDVGFWPIYFEETDFCHRARGAGWEIATVPASIVVHHESQTTHAWSQKFLETYHRNRLRYLIKNRTLREWPRTLRAEATWLAQHAPWDQLMPLAKAYGWLPFIMADVARGHHSPK